MGIRIGSRYQRLNVYEVTAADGRKKATIPLRLVFPGQFSRYPDMIQHTFQAGETLARIAYIYYNDPQRWWIIADANPLKFPFDWAPGDIVMVPPPRVAASL